MLTNLDWIGTGKPFPPESEKPRIAKYRENELLFDGAHNMIFRGDYSRIEAALRKRHQDPMVVLNYPQLLTKKTADFVCGEPPGITVEKKTNDKLNAVLAKQGFNTLLYEAVMDISRFGDAPVKLLGDRVSSVAPDCWFPVVDPTDLKRVTQHVVAFGTNPDGNGNFSDIYVEIHNIGSAEVREYKAAYATEQQMQFGALVSEKVTATGLDDFGVQVLKNVGHSKSVYGMDDYNAIRAIVEGITWRLHCIDQVLDKHSEPSLSVPQSAMSHDDKTGLDYLDLGKAFMRNNKDDASVEYITWNGNLEAAFKELELLINQLYVVSEMGAAFMEGGGQGAATSGTALKLRLVSPRIKAQRIAGVNTQTLKQLVALIAKVNNIALDADDISINWNDGLPGDPVEEIAILLQANGGQPVESQFSTIRRWNGYDNDEDAEEMQEEIWAETDARTPAAFGEPGGVNGGQDNETDTPVPTGAE